MDNCIIMEPILSVLLNKIAHWERLDQLSTYGVDGNSKLHILIIVWLKFCRYIITVARVTAFYLENPGKVNNAAGKVK